MRTSGILMPISSLPSRYGIGTIGEEAKKYVDFLEKSGQTFWQILPLNPTGYGDSPYSSFSTYAGNPYFIDLEYLIDEQLLTAKECEAMDWGGSPVYVDYANMYTSRYHVLRLAYERFLQDIPEDYEAFCEKESFWLNDYALFMALKNENAGKAWYTWETPLKKRHKKAIADAIRRNEKEIGFYKMLQYFFFRQWDELKDYANEHGILIIGDIPIYVSLDSADVWSDPKQFQLNKDLLPTAVAGCPPDGFSADGQLWGNPLYNWNAMKKDNFEWWARRVEATGRIYDVIRIDHFRAFAAYFSIPYGDKNARGGHWVKGPGIAFFEALESRFGELPIIVEDLGTLDQDVYDLLDACGYPGMKVLQFGFDNEDNMYQPHNHKKHCVIYTGTHDNDTSIGWLRKCSPETFARVKAYGNLNAEEGYHWGMMRMAWSSCADICIIPMMDVLGLDTEARINMPSTTGNNWKWRMAKGAATDMLAAKLLEKMHLYGRIPNWEDEEETAEELNAEAADTEAVSPENCGEAAAKEPSSETVSVEETAAEEPAAEEEEPVIHYNF